MHYMLVALRLPCKGCFCISITSAFLCGRAQKIQIRYTCGHVFRIRQNKTLLLLTLKTIKKFQRENATAFAYIANKSTVEKTITNGTYQTGVFPKVLNNSSA